MKLVAGRGQILEKFGIRVSDFTIRQPAGFLCLKKLILGGWPAIARFLNTNQPGVKP